MLFSVTIQLPVNADKKFLYSISQNNDNLMDIFHYIDFNNSFGLQNRTMLMAAVTNNNVCVYSNGDVYVNIW